MPQTCQDGPVAVQGTHLTGQRPLLERPSLVYCPSRGLSRHLDPISKVPVAEVDTPLEEENFSISLGLDVADTCLPRYARVLKHSVIPPRSMRFLATDVSTIKGEEWVVSKSFSSRPSREWIVPNVLLKSHGKTLYVPVINLSNRSLQWARDSELAPVERLEVHATAVEENPVVCSAAEGHSPSLPSCVQQDLLVGSGLNEEERTRLFCVLDRFSGCFDDGAVATPTHGVEHRIDTGDALPISTTLRRTSAFERRLISDQVQDMLSKGIIERSSSPWAAQVVMVPKRDGTRRFCVDFRFINAKTKRDVYPLPRIDEILERVGQVAGRGTKFMSSLDLKNGFWQVPIREQDREKTAFITSDGLFQFRKMPFGLSNSPATFQRLMDQVLQCGPIAWSTWTMLLFSLIRLMTIWTDSLPSCPLYSQLG